MVAKDIRPFHNDDPRGGHDVVKSQVFQFINFSQTVKIHVKQGKPAGVFVDDGIGWAGDVIGFGDTKAPGQSLDKGGFSCTQVAFQGDDHGRDNACAYLFSQGLGLVVGGGI